MSKSISILMLSLFCIVASAHAQITFSKRFHLNFPAAVFTGLELIGDTFAVAGVVRDSVPPYKQGSSLTFFDQSGSLLSSKVNVYNNKTYTIWSNVLTAYKNNLYALGYSVDSLMKGLLIKYNLSGDIEWERALPSFIEEGAFFKFNDLLILNDKIYITGYNIIYGGQEYEGEVIFVVYSIDGELLTTHSYGQPVWTDKAESIIQLDDNTLILAGLREKTHVQDQNYDFQTQLIAVDTLGEELWQWRSPTDQIQQGAQSMLATPDGGLIIATALGTEFPVDPELNDVYWDCYIFKLTHELEQEWGTLLAVGGTNPIHEFNKIIAVSDESGYLAVGVQAVNYFYGDINIENTGDIGGYIVKVSPDGEKLWSRVIIHPDLPTFLELHNLYDVAETPDGGFIMVGRSTDLSGTEAIPIQGWLLKVDEYGCLVPGCHLVSAAEEVDNAQPKLLLYPNPVEDILNVYLGPGTIPERSLLRIIDVQGKVWQQRRAELADATYLVVVDELPVGTYFSQLIDESGRVLGIEQFVKH